MAVIDTFPHPVLDNYNFKEKEDPCFFFFYSLLIPKDQMTTLLKINRMKPEVCKIFIKILMKTSFDRRASALGLLKTPSKEL